MKKENNRIDSNSIDRSYLCALISFIASAICIYIIIWQRGVLGNGNYTILTGDLRENYIPAIRNLCRDILNGESIFYSWNISLGMNTSLYNAYYAYNPFNVLYLFFYGKNDNAFVIFLIVLKTGLGAGIFCRYICRQFDIKNIWGIVISICYSLCAFNVIFNTHNIIWLDAIFILPIVFEGVDRVIEGNGIVRLVSGYAYIFAFQFYMGYMIGVASSIYFLLRILMGNSDKEWKLRLITVRNYFCAVMLAVGISSVVWLPALLFLMNNNPADIVLFEGLKTNPATLYAFFFLGHTAGVEADYPNVYCGLLPLLLIPPFFLSKKVNIKDKVIFGVLLGLLIISCFFEPLYKMWHGFDIPDGWTFRFAYIVSFVGCVIAAKFLAIADKSCIWLIASSAIGLYIVYIISLKQGYDSLYRWGMLANVVFLALWCVVLSLYMTGKPVLVKTVLLLIIPLACFELILAYTDKVHMDTPKYAYDMWDLNQNEILDYLKKDYGLYRVRTECDLGISSGTYYGYNNISYYSTAENVNTRNALEKIGLSTTPRMVLGVGVTPITEMLLNIKYDVKLPVIKNDMSIEETYIKVDEASRNLGIGYMIAGKMSDYNIDGKNVFENINYLLSTMTGKNVAPFEYIDKDRVEISQNGVRLSKTETGYMVDTDPPQERKGDVSLDFEVEDGGEQVYCTLYHDISAIATEGFLLSGGEENGLNSWGKLSASYIKKLDKKDGKYCLSVIPIENAWRQSFEDFYFAGYADSETQKAYEELEKNVMEIYEYSDSCVKGRVSSTEDKTVLLTTIPYDPGWTASVNGKRCEVHPVINDGFCAVELPVCTDCDVIFEFSPSGRSVSVALSVISLLIFSGIMLKEKKNLKKN